MFDAHTHTEKIIQFIQNYFKSNNLKGAVVGISGGKDSAVVAGLFSKAIGPENVIGITLPCKSNKQDLEDAMLVAKTFGIELVNIDLTNTYTTLKEKIKKVVKDESKLVNSDINIKPRLRMSTLYYMAAYYTAFLDGTYVVAGTGNKSEEYVGYFTKGGDSVSDIKVLSDLTVSEVIKVGEVIGVPKKVLYKTPSDGISGKSDEENLKVSYEDIEKYLNNEKIDSQKIRRIEDLHKAAYHKFNIPEYKK